MKEKVLWIEDTAITDLAILTGPVYACGRYDIDIAENVSEGIDYILQHQYDAIIIDIRLPPGKSPLWRNLYKETGATKKTAKLGLQLLDTILGVPEAKISLDRPMPEWIIPEIIGVLTIEGRDELKENFERLSIGAYRQKNGHRDHTVLLNIIDEILVV